MSRFTQWYVREQLQRMGWPRTKGIFRKTSYVNTMVVDVAVEQALQTSIGLGAGRPELGVAVLADAFANDPWTSESVAKLLTDLGADSEQAVEINSSLTPWKALYVKHRLALAGNEIPWQQLGDDGFYVIWSVLSATAVYWGLTHEAEMPNVFADARADYERTAREWIPHGLDVSEEFPWNSLDHFYDNCEELVQAFQMVRPPFADIPNELRAAPIVTRRLGA